MPKMAEDILILEPDKEFAARLVQALNKVGSYSISVVPTVKEACLHLVQSPKDLAFVPIHEGAKIIRSLRAIQPDLRLVLVTPTADVEIPVTYSGRIQSILIKPMLEADLPAIMQDVLAQPFYVREAAELDAPRPGQLLDTAVLVSLLHQTDLGHFIKSAIVAREHKLMAYWGELNERECATVALHVGKGWLDSGPERLQFLHLPARAGDMLLYTCQRRPNYLLTLVALPETPVGELRRRSLTLASLLDEVASGRTTPAGQAFQFATKEENVHGRITYAIVWRPIEPLADALIPPLRQALLRLASANGFVLTHLHIQPDLVHILATCPPGRDANWVAALFKSGSEQTIQQEYGVVVSLWEPGFYATETTRPLTPSELNLFLEHSPSPV
jgi:REP element-mobilizing transposase RayT